MDATPEPVALRESSGVFVAGRRFVSALWAHAESRLQLLTLELAEERDRTVGALVAAGMLVIFGGLALAFTGFGVIVAMWDSPYRLLTVILVPVVFAAAAVVAWWWMQRQVGQASALFKHSMAEWHRDVQALRARLESEA